MLTSDPGKLMPAKLPGECAECGGNILPGQPIYFSKLKGPRHKRCVDPGEPAPAAATEGERAPRAASDASARDGGRDGGWLFDDGSAAPSPPREEASRDGASRAPARATEFGRAGDRDAARRELGEVLELLIDALRRIRRLLA